VAIAVLGALAVVFLKQSTQAGAANGGGQPEVRSSPPITLTAHQQCTAFTTLLPTPAAADRLLSPCWPAGFRHGCAGPAGKPPPGGRHAAAGAAAGGGARVAAGFRRRGARASLLACCQPSRLLLSCKK
jgi:hypothetical protein